MTSLAESSAFSGFFCCFCSFGGRRKQKPAKVGKTNFGGEFATPFCPPRPSVGKRLTVSFWNGTNTGADHVIQQKSDFWPLPVPTASLLWDSRAKKPGTALQPSIMYSLPMNTQDQCSVSLQPSEIAGPPSTSDCEQLVFPSWEHLSPCATACHCLPTKSYRTPDNLNVGTSWICSGALSPAAARLRVCTCRKEYDTKWPCNTTCATSRGASPSEWFSSKAMMAIVVHRRFVDTPSRPPFSSPEAPSC